MQVKEYIGQDAQRPAARGLVVFHPKYRLVKLALGGVLKGLEFLLQPVLLGLLLKELDLFLDVVSGRHAAILPIDHAYAGAALKFFLIRLVGFHSCSKGLSPNLVVILSPASACLD